ncbi:hypothetical protein OCH239_10775 [Roseivivax halodurans JCM 10272]|uniref:Uncharacterized protein n=1 Tax=Roseivivax halodurans JCM 10272 TaxID=1449350 RepID=X7EDW8_9RHOB|nr:hypothetical protein OCH239_10775 [Roseivivax halodurans JCM 10272]
MAMWENRSGKCGARSCAQCDAISALTLIGARDKVKAESTRMEDLASFWNDIGDLGHG